MFQRKIEIARSGSIKTPDLEYADDPNSISNAENSHAILVDKSSQTQNTIIMVEKGSQADYKQVKESMAILKTVNKMAVFNRSNRSYINIDEIENLRSPQESKGTLLKLPSIEHNKFGDLKSPNLLQPALDTIKTEEIENSPKNNDEEGHSLEQSFISDVDSKNDDSDSYEFDMEISNEMDSEREEVKERREFNKIDKAITILKELANNFQTKDMIVYLLVIQEQARKDVKPNFRVNSTQQ